MPPFDFSGWRHLYGLAACDLPARCELHLLNAALGNCTLKAALLDSSNWCDVRRWCDRHGDCRWWRGYCHGCRRWCHIHGRNESRGCHKFGWRLGLGAQSNVQSGRNHPITQSPNHPITQAAGAGPVAVYLVACVSAKVDVFSQALDETSSILPSRLFKPMPCLRG